MPNDGPATRKEVLNGRPVIVIESPEPEYYPGSITVPAVLGPEEVKALRNYDLDEEADDPLEDVYHRNRAIILSWDITGADGIDDPDPENPPSYAIMLALIRATTPIVNRAMLRPT